MQEKAGPTPRLDGWKVAEEAKKVPKLSQVNVSKAGSRMSGSRAKGLRTKGFGRSGCLHFRPAYSLSEGLGIYSDKNIEKWGNLFIQRENTQGGTKGIDCNRVKVRTV